MASRQWSLMNSRAGVPATAADGFAHFLGNRYSVIRLVAQLYRGHARTCHAAHPVGIGQHGIQAECRGQVTKALARGVGCKPKSRGSLGQSAASN